jgi:hypothetical protein
MRKVSVRNEKLSRQLKSNCNDFSDGLLKKDVCHCGQTRSTIIYGNQHVFEENDFLSEIFLTVYVSM